MNIQKAVRAGMAFSLFLFLLTFQNCGKSGFESALSGSFDSSSRLGSPTDPLANDVLGPTCSDTSAPAVAPLQRLTQYEYNNVIRDLFGLTTDFASSFSGDNTGTHENFSTFSAGQTVTMDTVMNFWNAAENVTNAVFAKSPNPFLACTTKDEACAKTTITTFAAKAFRRPILQTETDSLVTLYRANASSFDEGMKTVLKAMLISPQFIFRSYDLPTGNVSSTALTSYELASRVAFFIWGSIPDEPLRAVAANGTLTNPAVLEAQVRRMLKDPKATYLQNIFAQQWLGTTYGMTVQTLDTTRYPDWNETLRASMIAEANMFISSVFQGDQSVMTLINGKYTYLNQTLSTHYKLSGGTSNTLVKVENANARGLLTQGSFLSMTSKSVVTSPVLRGKYVLARLLCADPGPPPANVPSAPEVEAGTGKVYTESQIREKMAAHTVAGSSCVGCHKTLDPIGYSLENYDSGGTFRSNYTDGVAVNAQGTLPSGVNINGVGDLSTSLYNDYRFRRCFTIKLSSFAQGRYTGSYPESCTEQNTANASVGPNYKFSDAVVTIVKSKNFLNRTVAY